MVRCAVREADVGRPRTAALRDLTPRVMEAFVASFWLPWHPGKITKTAIFGGLVKKVKQLWEVFKKLPHLWGQFKKLLGVESLTDIPGAIADLVKKGAAALKAAVHKAFDKWPLKLYTVEKGKLSNLSEILAKLMAKLPKFKHWLETKAKPQVDAFDKWIRKYLPGISHLALVAIYFWIWMNVVEFEWDMKSFTDVLTGSITLGDLLTSLPSAGLGFLLNGFGFGTFTLLPAVTAARVLYLMAHHVVGWTSNGFEINAEKVSEIAGVGREEVPA